MPNKKSAMKALRQDSKKSLRNFKVKRKIKDLVKDSKKLIEGKDSKATETVKTAIKAIDKAVQNKVLKKNTGARKKSRLMKVLNKSTK